MPPKKSPKQPPANRVAALLRAELLIALDASPFNVQALAMVERIAKTGRALLLATSSDVGQQIAATARPVLGLDEIPAFPGYDLPVPMAPAPPAETFGTNALREMIAAVKSTTPKPKAPLALDQTIPLYELQSGIRSAKESGDTLTVARLERALSKRLDAIDPPIDRAALKLLGQGTKPKSKKAVSA